VLYATNVTPAKAQRVNIPRHCFIVSAFLYLPALGYNSRHKPIGEIVNYPALKDGACREYPTSQVDQGKRTPTRYVCHRSLRPTAVCFLSTGHWKTGITLAKGKAPKVSVAAQAGAGGRHSRGEIGFGLRHKARKGIH